MRVDHQNVGFLSTDTQFWTPFEVLEDCTMATAGVHCQNPDAGSACRIGIYSNNNGVPDALLAQSAAEISLGTGLFNWQAANLVLALTKGWYWGSIHLKVATTGLSLSCMADGEGRIAQMLGAAAGSSEAIMGSPMKGYSLARTFNLAGASNLIANAAGLSRVTSTRIPIIGFTRS